MKFGRRIFNLFALMVTGALTLIVYASHAIQSEAAPALFTSSDSVPHMRVALVLGCSPFLRGGWRNPFFDNRMAAAALLFRAGKADFLLLSGDNHTTHYDEPSAMKEALVQLGVPEEKLVLDYAGFSTSDSVIRAQQIFGLNDICVVSQPDHAMRAIYIARHKGINAVGFAAQDIAFRYGWRTRGRESLARVRTLLDVHVWNRKPHFLGPGIEIENESSRSLLIDNGPFPLNSIPDFEDLG